MGWENFHLVKKMTFLPTKMLQQIHLASCWDNSENTSCHG